MRNKTWPLGILSLLLIALLVGACQRRATPEPTPTAPPPTVAPTTAPTVQPTAATPAATAPAESGLEVDWEPQVIYSSPAAGATTALDGAITVRFDQPMDQASVEQAFAVTAADGNAAAGVFTWTQPDTVVFTPQATLQRAAQYNVQIGAGARGQNGRQLRAPLALDFATVGFLEVSQIIPADRTTAVAADAAITVVFNRPVVPLVGTMQQDELPQPIAIDPPVAGQGMWVGTSIYRFTPDAGLAGATTYRVTVAADLTDVTGGVLAAPVSAEFTTVAPAVVGTTPPFDGGLIAPDGTISVTFNMPMDRALTGSAVTLDPPTPFSTRWSADGRVLGLTPSELMTLATEYTLSVGTGATAANGSATLAEPYVGRFDSYPFPGVDSTSPGDGETIPDYAVGFYGGVTIWFRTPMNFANVADQIEVQPAPDEISFQNYAPEALQVSFDLDYNQTYTVIVRGGIQDTYGNAMGEDYSFTFSTPDAPSLASLNLPQAIAQISTSFPSEISLLTRNITSANVQLLAYGSDLPLALLNQGYYFGSPELPGGTLLREFEINIPYGPLASQPLALADGFGTLPTGIYGLRVSSPDIDRENAYWQNLATLLVVADTNLVIKETPDAVHIWATDLASGQPAAGRALTLYAGFDDNTTPPERVASATTDANGLATIAKDWPELDAPYYGYRRSLLAISATPGAAGFGMAATGWAATVQPYDFGVSAIPGPERPETAFLTSDRPLYRAGDSVYLRGWLRSSDYARYGLPQSSRVTLRIQGPDYTREADIVTLDVDAAGGFYGEYSVPADAALGLYSVTFEDNSGTGYEGRTYHEFTVAEFRAPDIQVSVTGRVAEARRDQTIEAVVAVDYFFGGAAAGLPVEYTVYANPYSLPWDGPYYSFSDDSDFVYDPYFFGGPVDQYVTGGSGELDANGELVIRVTPEEMQRLTAGGLTLTFEARVTDANQVITSGRGDVVVHAADRYVGIRSQTYATPLGTPLAFDVLSLDRAGALVPNAAVDVALLLREWRSQPADDGSGRILWQPVDTEIDTQRVTTDAQGRATATFEVDEGGVYVGRATIADDAGRTNRAAITTYIYGADTTWRFDARDRQIELVANAPAYQVGDTAEVLVQSPFGGPLQAWLTIERGNVIEQRIITLSGGSELLQLPIAAEHAPNVFVTVTAIKGIDDSAWQYPDIRYGVVELIVDPARLALNLAITTEREAYAPRDTVRYEIRATDYSGAPVAADLMLALVDEAILSLKPDTTPPLLETFYARQPLRSRIGSGLFVSGEGLADEAPNQGAGGRGGGGGGVAEDAAAFDVQREGGDGVRSDFRDTAYWLASISTDANGIASVEVTLPDNLTTWRMTARGVSADTLVGETTNQIIATKFLLIRPVTPRFLTFGDVVQLGAVVNNNTDAAIEASVLLEATGVTLTGPAEQTVSVPARGSTLVRWPVTVQDAAAADLTFRVAGGGYSDATKPTVSSRPDRTLPIVRFNAEDIVATAGVLGDENRRVEAVLLPPLLDSSQGALSVNLSPSLAAAVITALEALNSEPYDDYTCAYSVAARLLPNAVTAAALADLDLGQPALAQELDQLIAADVAQLATLQRNDGGWGWCASSSESSAEMTAFALLALVRAGEAGHAAGGSVLTDAARYLRRQVDVDVLTSADAGTAAYYLYALALAGEDVRASLDTLVTDSVDLLDAEALSMALLAYRASGGATANEATLLSRLNNAVVLSATGAHWEAGASRFWGSDIRVTALAIDALLATDAQNGVTANAVRWLMQARRGPYWTGTFDNAFALTALANWMRASGELDADYDYALRVNGGLVADGAFSRANIAQTVGIDVALGDLLADDVNFLDFTRDGDGRLYYTAYLDAFVSADSVEAVDRGFYVTRAYYDADCDAQATVCAPLTSIAAGQEVRVELTIVVPNNHRFVRIEDPLPAGADAVDPNLATSPLAATAGQAPQPVDYRFGYWGWWYFERIEFRDDKVVFFADYLPAGTYQYTYTLQTIVPGEYQVMPTTAREILAPEVFGRANGAVFTITE